MLFFFFFSSRRRHTRLQGDWSSDVCSSDLLGVTSSSGPGMALKTEMLGLAIATELPIVVVDSQRAGPSTGMPTKAEQSDLFQAVHGRNADAPLAGVAPAAGVGCLDVATAAG